MKLGRKDFDKAVQRAIKRIPREIRRHLDNILISVRQNPSPDLLEAMGLPPDEPLLGIYQGASLLERSTFNPPLYPDTIFIFQRPLEEMCETIEELEEQIEITVVHEVAHFLGIDEERLIELGYE
ncbi:MAG TPA: metallopeptidase family protein [Syntrophales bacterium]|nr:metallopeptidase family protein [Syntrophales bacterium]HOX95508.1 metallopeptidase family protein [Syntrophales bacterium]HPI57477.1 metallopeptidase family protein [Syntrophales bacterium]HPN25666.1 metallopeptidase family protein [Syntrophales bacterium]HQM29502.1 metallopeptidase family protein [Syntrophales bacterium]